MPRQEPQRPNPLSSYAVSKLVAEPYCIAAQLLDVTIAPAHGPLRPRDVPESLADIALALDLLGYEPVSTSSPG